MLLHIECRGEKIRVLQASFRKAFQGHEPFGVGVKVAHRRRGRFYVRSVSCYLLLGDRSARVAFMRDQFHGLGKGMTSR